MTMSKLCEEMVAQHARIHEREHRGKGYGKSTAYKGMKGYGKKSSWRAYHAETEDNNDWENASQSLGGYEELDEVSYHAYETEETYADEVDPVFDAYAALVENGMDENDQESLDYAAEILQAESEVYYARQSASSGQKGFAWGGSRDYQVQGHLSFEEKKAKLQQVKNRTTCKRCGQYGHWQNDPICPKGSGKSGKGKGKKPSSSSGVSSASTSGTKGKGGKSSKSDKPRNVYFTINEYENQSGWSSNYGYMVVKEEMREVPPPSSLQHGVVLPASSNEEVRPGPEIAPDELLELMIAEADRREHQKRLKRREDEVSEDEIEEPTSEEIKQYLATPSRIQHLDRYLAVADQSTAEYGDVYQERWTEFFPGHPLFVETDRANLKRWIMKAKLGLPVLPLEDQKKERPVAVQGESTIGEIFTPEGISPNPMALVLQRPGEGIKASETSTRQTCQHLRTTKQGSNAYASMLKCKDCGEVLSHQKTEKPARMEVKHTGECDHPNKDFRGTTATTWKWKCKDCGHQESGMKKPGQKGSDAAASTSKSQADATSEVRVEVGASSRDVLTDGNEAERIMELMIATIEVQKEMGNQVGLRQLDVVYQHCKDYIARKGASSSSTTFMATSSSTRPSATRGGSRAMPERTETPPLRWAHRIMETGVHKGKTFSEIFENEKTYMKSIISKHTTGNVSNQCLKDFAVFAKAEIEKTTGKVAFMSQQDLQEGDPEDMLMAILDTGCNNTCHGSGWMLRFQEMMGKQLPEEPAEGRFNGVGGKVEVSCRRTIPMSMETVDMDRVPGTISSIELKDSDAPLLLSIWAQKALGLIIDVEANTAYSKKLDVELRLVNYKGLPAIRLMAGVEEADSVAMLASSIIDLEELDGITQQEDEEQEPQEEKEDAEDENGDWIEEGSERHLPIQEGEVKILNKGKKKELGERLQDMEKEDSALWSTLGSAVRRPRKMLPRGCKTFLMEIFAGAATLSCLAAQMGLDISSPIDIDYYPEYDLLKKENRDKIWQQVEKDDPFLVTMAPVCGPWSMWQNYNVTRSPEIEAKIYQQRKEWYPVVCWMMDLARSRIEKGREVLMENPKDVAVEVRGQVLGHEPVQCLHW